MYRTSIPRFPKRQRETRHMSLDAVSLFLSQKISIESNHAASSLIRTPTPLGPLRHQWHLRLTSMYEFSRDNSRVWNIGIVIWFSIYQATDSREYSVDICQNWADVTVQHRSWDARTHARRESRNEADTHVRLRTMAIIESSRGKMREQRGYDG